MDIALTNEQLAEKIEGITGKASELVERLEASGKDAESVKAIHDEVQMLTTQVQPLIMEQAQRTNQAQVKAITDQVTELSAHVKGLHDRARLPEFSALTGSDEGTGYHGGEYSFFGDIAKSYSGGKAGQQARERLTEALEQEGGKAFTSADTGAGAGDVGYLINPERLGVFQARERLAGPLEGRVPTINVQTDSIEFVKMPNAGLGTAGWVAELATKGNLGEAEPSLFTSNVYTAAALAVASNQVLEDSSIDRYIVQQITRRLNHVFEQAILAGTGTGQPLGILNTGGTNSQVYTNASPTVPNFLVNAVAPAIAKTLDSGFVEPQVIVMRPQLWTNIITAGDAATGSFYYGSSAGDPRQRQGDESIFIDRQLFGIPVVLSMNIPTNLGAGTNESRVIIADLSDDLIVQRHGLRFDKSEHVYFTSNQTVFRGEFRKGFTAGIFPASHTVISGTGVINTFA